MNTAVSPDGLFVVAVASDGCLYGWEVKSRVAEALAKKHSCESTPPSFKFFLGASYSGTSLCFCRTLASSRGDQGKTGGARPHAQVHLAVGFVDRLVLWNWSSPTASKLPVGEGETLVRDKGRERRRKRGTGEDPAVDLFKESERPAFNALAFDQASSVLVAGCGDGSLRCWRLFRERTRGNLDDHAMRDVEENEDDEEEEFVRSPPLTVHAGSVQSLVLLPDTGAALCLNAGKGRGEGEGGAEAGGHGQGHGQGVFLKTCLIVSASLDATVRICIVRESRPPPGSPLAPQLSILPLATWTPSLNSNAYLTDPSRLPGEHGTKYQGLTAVAADSTGLLIAVAGRSRFVFIASVHPSGLSHKVNQKAAALAGERPKPTLAVPLSQTRTENNAAGGGGRGGGALSVQQRQAQGQARTGPPPKPRIEEAITLKYYPTLVPFIPTDLHWTQRQSVLCVGLSSSVVEISADTGGILRKVSMVTSCPSKSPSLSFPYSALVGSSFFGEGESGNEREGKRGSSRGSSGDRETEARLTALRGPVRGRSRVRILPGALSVSRFSVSAQDIARAQRAAESARGGGGASATSSSASTRVVDSVCAAVGGFGESLCLCDLEGEVGESELVFGGSLGLGVGVSASSDTSNKGRMEVPVSSRGVKREREAPESPSNEIFLDASRGVWMMKGP
uniref:Uncharacterized protein n=1 Tax=Chromera velia CCMP2878 TaxID=1169474 RepID=A0A0G4H3R0_9ALVE|eukprot:Cvel_24585.t1-p1 / transcript=Cvel_24585.t1 / gene=Cvel_24585 / organism=Chromera_velia_CCMP2878 / gene_product=hypothetical protein / transcript_product=hypothetical protein / location=Cvel_scaffold2676:10095-17735(-) / protein_length=677 / sequence_SO=supercontig / SO=protein_coding / is_pseudo=false